MIKYDLQYFGGRGASGTLKNPNGKVAKNKNAIKAIEINMDGKVLRYADRGKYGITGMYGDYEVHNTGGKTIEDIKKRAESMGYEVKTYTEKQLNEAENAYWEERKNRPDYELGYNLPWGNNKEHRKAARRNRLSTRVQRRK